MTPEQLTGLAALLLDLKDWIEEQDPGSLDIAIVDEAVAICGIRRRQLQRAGAQ